MIAVEDATKVNAVKDFGELLEAIPKSKRANFFIQSVTVETVMMTALSYLEHALPDLDASKDAKINQLAKEVRLMLGIKEEEKKATKKK
jgi:hypothetical protein